MTPKEILSVLDEYCSRTGMRRSTVCLRALGNGRLPERLERRIESDEEYGRRLIEYIEANPAAVSSKGDAA